MVSNVQIYGESDTLVQQIAYTYYDSSDSGPDQYGNLTPSKGSGVFGPSQRGRESLILTAAWESDRFVSCHDVCERRAADSRIMC
jgi:hypothetical protein